MSANHPTEEELRRLLLADETLSDALETHLNECADCRERLDHLSGATEFSAAFEPESLGPDRLASMVLAPSDTPGVLGKLGRYEVDEWIATGGMSTVWRGRDPDRDQVVAIKVMHPMLAAQPAARSRFIREAGAGMALCHSAILPVLDLNEEHDPPFFVMQFAGGGSLQQRLSHHPLAFDETLRIAKALTGALVAAHEAGVIHRDIKPANILFADSGEVMLADFGIARALEQETMLTQTGSFLGTPQYMSPEQAAGDNQVDERSDLFSLGAVLHQMCTGRPAFEGETFKSLSQQVQEEVPPLFPDPSPTPPWLQHLVMRLLAKRPDDRPASAKEVLLVLSNEHDLGLPETLQLAGGQVRRRMLIRRYLGRAAVLAAVALTALGWAERAGHTSLVNHLLCGLSGEAYYVTGTWGTFGTLDKAVEAASDGDIIEVRTNEPATGRGGLRVPVGKSLTIRAAAGFRPVLQLQASGFPALAVVDSNLVMEGFVFIHTTKALRAGRLIHVRGASMKLVKCRFVRQPRPPDAMQSTLHALIAATDSPRIEVIDCEFYAPGSPLFGLIAESLERTDVSLTRCHLWGATVWCDDKPPAKLHVTMTDCEVFATDVLHLHQALPAHELVLQADRNLIQAFGSAIHCPWPIAKLDSILQWTGQGNRWFLPGQVVIAQDGRRHELFGEKGSVLVRELAMPFNQKDFEQALNPAHKLRIVAPKN